MLKHKNILNKQQIFIINVLKKIIGNFKKYLIYKLKHYYTCNFINQPLKNLSFHYSIKLNIMEKIVYK